MIVIILLVAFADQQRSVMDASLELSGAPYPLPPQATRRPYPWPGGTPTALPNVQRPATATPRSAVSAAYPLPGPGGNPTPVSYPARAYFPLVFGKPPYKGTAEISRSVSDLGFTKAVTMGVQWGYSWNHVYATSSGVYTLPYQIVHDVRSNANPFATSPMTWAVWVDYEGATCPNWRDTSAQPALRNCVASVAAAHPGSYWMIWNEPDWCTTPPDDPYDSDCISPLQAVRYFNEISGTIRGADLSARMIVGNVFNQYQTNPQSSCGYQGNRFGCGVYWLTQFISAYITMTNGIDPRPAIAGYGFHAYGTTDLSGLGGSDCGDTYASTADDCIVQHITTTITTALNWVSANDLGKEVWITELNWESGKSSAETWEIQTRRMQKICEQLPSMPINRYAWFYGGYPWDTSATWIITDSLYSATPLSQSAIYTGALSPAGNQFVNCP